MNPVPERLKCSHDQVELDAGLSVLHQGNPLPGHADDLRELSLETNPL